jgi:hypothetical protein
MEVVFCIRNKSIIYTYKNVDSKDRLVIFGLQILTPSGKVAFPLDMEKINHHHITLNGKDISQSLPCLFSGIQDKTIWKNNRHEDDATQAFIAWQNAKFSKDIAFRCTMAVLFTYRALENSFEFYITEAERLIPELLSLNDKLTEDLSVRKHRFQLYTSLTYVFILLSLLKGDAKGVVEVGKSFFQHANQRINEDLIPPNAYNFVKISTLYILLFEHIEVSRTHINKQCLELAQNCFGLFKLSSPIEHFHEYKVIINDIVHIQALSHSFSSPSYLYRSMGKSQLKTLCFKSAMRIGECETAGVIQSKIEQVALQIEKENLSLV